MDAKKKRPRILFGVVGGVLGFVLVVLVVVFDLWMAEGPAMEPTLFSGDRFVTTPFAAAGLGDVVVIAAPTGTIAVKRIVGVAGDTIDIRGGAVHRNGEPIASGDARASVDGEHQCRDEILAGERWVTLRRAASPPEDLAPVEVPAGHVYVLGDRRDRSNDSRYYGPVRTDEVRGVFVWRYFGGGEPRCP